MNELNSEGFLRRYRILEGLLEKRYAGKKIGSSSVVIEYLRDADSVPVRTDLDLLREIRNILSHNAGADGSAVVEPSDETLRRLEKVIRYVQTPRKAGDFGTPASDIYSANTDSLLRTVMKEMWERGYSHVPVIDHGVVIGVFSVKALFDYIARRGIGELNSDTCIGELRDVIELEAHSGERYCFVSADTSIVEVRREFESMTEKNNRTVAVLVTRNGHENEQLISMITPWDVLRDHTPEPKMMLE